MGQESGFQAEFLVKQTPDGLYAEDALTARFAEAIAAYDAIVGDYAMDAAA